MTDHSYLRWMGTVLGEPMNEADIEEAIAMIEEVTGKTLYPYQKDIMRSQLRDHPL